MKKLSVLFLVFVLAIFFTGCGKKSPTTPTPTPTPTPPSPPTITGVTVTSDHSTIVVGNTEKMTATVTMSDGTTKAGIGTWSCNNTVRATVNQAGLLLGRQAGNVNIFFDNTAGGRGSKSLTIRNIWKKSGNGDTVFDMPTYVERVRIIGTYNGYSSNFIVYVGGDLLVNELLGTGWGQTRYDGTLLTTGGVVEIQHSSGVSWSFEEKSPQNTLINFPRPNIWHHSIPNGDREFEIYKRVSEGKWFFQIAIMPLGTKSISPKQNMRLSGLNIPG